ncbi:MAG: serpin family protein, partial [Chloroflexi bacterium]|nr:serpin family protein [Chloroflexota bacterium]
AAEEARQTINAWVSEETEGRIQDLIPEGALNEITRLVLTNATYFYASWQDPFRVENTSDGKFFALDGDEVWVSMMRRQGHYRYVHSAGYRAIEIPYIGNALVMTVIVPDADRFEAFQAGLDAEQLQAIVGSLDTSELVDLAFPRFRCESAFSLGETLQALGMTDAFAYGPANFAGMDGTRDLFISDVVHKAFVDVNEEGTEAAAATAVIVAAGAAAPSRPVNMTIDRPFIYLIRDRGTGEVLFIGRVLNPVE